MLGVYSVRADCSAVSVIRRDNEKALLVSTGKFYKPDAQSVPKISMRLARSIEHDFRLYN